MATPSGLEPSTSSVTGWRANRLHNGAKYGGDNRARTCDPMLVRHVLSQLSYAPFVSLSCCSPQRRGSLYTRKFHLSSTFFKNFRQIFSLYFPCYSHHYLALWGSRLARQPVTLEVDGSSPFGVAIKSQICALRKLASSYASVAQ